MIPGGHALSRQDSTRSNSSMEGEATHFVGAGPQEAKLLKRMYGLELYTSSNTEEVEEMNDPPKVEKDFAPPRMLRRASDATIRGDRHKGMNSTDSVDEGGEGDDEGLPDVIVSEIVSKQFVSLLPFAACDEALIGFCSDADIATIGIVKKSSSLSTPIQNSSLSWHTPSHL
jgi:hypothetical protein